MFSVLRHYGIPEVIVNAISALYNNSKSAAKEDTYTYTWYTTSMWEPPGCDVRSDTNVRMKKSSGKKKEDATQEREKNELLNLIDIISEADELIHKLLTYQANNAFMWNQCAF